MNTPTCEMVVDTDENEYDVECGEPAVFQCCDQKLCHQCAHDWLDELDNHQEHTVMVLSTKPQPCKEGGQGEEGKTE